MQLNMGEGKSSVIVPITSAHLADVTQLVRVIVPKPLSNQMFDLLKQRTSGLADHRIFYLPFNRNTSLNATGVRRCWKPSSFAQLTAVFYFPSRATPWHNTQRWIRDNSRDILDESNEILNVKYQLICTVGSASTLASERWCLVQGVLFLVKFEARGLLDDYKEQLEVAESVGDFPYTLSEACAKELTQRLAELIVMRIKCHQRSFTVIQRI
ncbi:hypothetical protein M422DRAFT_250633 [Sphaerobolus stellatus SS14]|uniref:DUF3638 domain-containing protein n=1 Tax=Sphaerobolus stellatus (strain SS14) TaxID=990650 RepID=A0A0C9VFU5_SPHS4|nr:hypothetical protein M422DRAFT_250633 [Sphaerobolus stellatus SS14]